MLKTLRLIKTLKRNFLIAVMLPALLSVSTNAASQDQIRLNQLGFYRYGPKVAVVIAPETWYFSIKSPDLATSYHTGELSALESWSRSGEEVKSADFSSFTRKGTYVVYISGIGASYPFTIGDDNFTGVARGLLRAFFFQRCSSLLPLVNAGLWYRGAGHPDNNVIIHESAQSDPSRPGARKTGETYKSPKGWYDAGDYGKYVVNAGISTYQLLILYELFPDYFNNFSLNIPESGDTIPDILDEIKWELDWLLTMQDPADGGVYHKVTTKTFTGDVMPNAATGSRYFIGKGSAATFDFAALLAAAHRIYHPFFPGFADSCLDAARYAWEWGTAHPDSTFSNPSDVVTGEYGDRSLRDEHAWAGFELFCATGDSSYRDTALSLSASYQLPEWPKVGLLGYYSMAFSRNDTVARDRILSIADGLVSRIGKNPYRTTISNEFYWGSNGVVANQGMALMIAFLLTKDFSYLEGAIHATDYLLGRNATGYSFVTGYGKRPAAHPHHRPSTADGVSSPVPGLLVGGPNRSAGDGCAGEYSSYPAKAWRDENCSYSTNEVAINWNAPAAFLAGAINAVFSSGAFDLSALENRYAADTSAPGAPESAVSGISADQVTLTCISTEPTVKTISYDTSTSFNGSLRCYQHRSDTTICTLTTLLPGTVYYFRCHLVDDNGNSSVSPVDSFKTENSPLSEAATADYTHSDYRIGSPLTISFSDSSLSSAQLSYAKGGDATSTALSFSPSGSNYSATIPAEDITFTGITYSVTLCDTSDTITTPLRSVAPDSITLSIPKLCDAGVYTMFSLPGRYPAHASPDLFGPVLGDTSQWRFFGYDPAESDYVAFDSLHSGAGGWLYAKKSGASFTSSTRALPPDTLFPIVVRRGWNCIGNPFPFPVYWSNSFIDLEGALASITDKAAFPLVYRQLFWYHDTLENGRHTGTYRTNRELTSHVFNDSATLEPWKAYWVYSEADSATLLINPHPAISTPVLKKLRHAPPVSWFCSVRVSAGTVHDDPVVFGCSEEARNDRDLYDVPKPPSLSKEISSAFVHNDWQTSARLFASDIAAFPSAADVQWQLEVTASSPHPVTLSWEMDNTTPGTIYLIDDAAGRTVSMDRSGTYTFTPDNTTLRRTILFARSEALPAVDLPTHWAFFRIPGSGYRFSYAVPRTTTDRQDIAITIFNLYGRTVRSLSSGKVRAGIRTVAWDGTTSDGTVAAHGMYIIRFSGGTFTKSIGCTHTR